MLHDPCLTTDESDARRVMLRLAKRMLRLAAMGCLCHVPYASAAEGARLLWAQDWPNAKVRAVNIDGGLPTDVAVGLEQEFSGIALGAVEPRLYWTDTFNARIQ